MKTVAIMQPYLFPYLGYFQLIHASDILVLYDDVQFIKGGWINRNFLLMNGQPSRFTFSLSSDSTFSLIKDRQLSNRFEQERSNFFKTLKTAYNKAPYYHSVVRLAEKILKTEDLSLSNLIERSLREIMQYLALDTEILISSQLEQNRTLTGAQRVIDLCKRLGATRYINAIGGQTLYDKQPFHKDGLELFFLKSLPVTYQQLESPFVSNLSILDVLMFNTPEHVKSLLNCYELI